MKRRIGILGGISHKSTARYYELIHEKYFQKHGDYHYPEVVVFSLDFQKFTDLENRGDRDGYIGYIVEGVASLEKAGAELVIMAANSPHAVFDEVRKRANVSMISIAEVTAQKAREEGMKRLLLMGIRFTMQSSFYQRVYVKYGIEIITPSEEEQELIDHIVFDELVLGLVNEESRRKLLGIIGNYDVDGVILGCTELPLILSQGDTNVRLLDTLELHVEAALERSLTD